MGSAKCGGRYSSTEGRRYALSTMDDELYRENILDHYKRPHNWSPPQAELEHADLEFHDLNPLCGDELTVRLALGEDGRVKDVRFSGHGCAISQAAASMTLGRDQGHEGGGASEARSLVCDRFARDRHFCHADEMRFAVAEGNQGRVTRSGGRVGT